MAQFEWSKRRRIIHYTLVFCAGIIASGMTYALVQGDTELVKTFVVAAFTSGMSLIGSYVFGAIWDDNNARKFGTPPPPPKAPE